MLNEGYNNLNINFEKYIENKKLGEISEEFINEENNNIIIHHIETCNKLGEIKAPQIKCTIRIEIFLIKTHALLDTGYTHIIIDEKIIPEIFITVSEKTMTAQQVDGTLNRYTNHLSTTTKIYFMTNCHSSP